MPKKREIELDPPYLDEEERELIEGMHRAMDEGALESKLTPEREAELREMARRTMNPPKQPISVRIAKPDLVKLKARAMELGMPYQTLLSSIVHQYVEGRLVERR